jgi:hypothetical protein
VLAVCRQILSDCLLAHINAEATAGTGTVGKVQYRAKVLIIR